MQQATRGLDDVARTVVASVVQRLTLVSCLGKRRGERDVVLANAGAKVVDALAFGDDVLHHPAHHAQVRAFVVVGQQPASPRLLQAPGTRDEDPRVAPVGAGELGRGVALGEGAARALFWSGSRVSTFAALALTSAMSYRSNGKSTVSPWTSLPFHHGVCARAAWAALAPNAASTVAAAAAARHSGASLHILPRCVCATYYQAR